jgi:hypothetical protein
VPEKLIDDNAYLALPFFVRLLAVARSILPKSTAQTAQTCAEFQSPVNGMIGLPK